MSSSIFLGIHGGVIALDRATGQTLWKAPLKGSDFVTVLLDNDRILAATKGAVFCLDPTTGQILWRNDLPGEGWGIVTIATASGSSNSVPLAEQKRRQDAAAASSAATTAVIASS